VAVTVTAHERERRGKKCREIFFPMPCIFLFGQEIEKELLFYSRDVLEML
jgi:hypothetical protein